MPIYMNLSDASPIGFGLKLNDATNATFTNSAFCWTTTDNDSFLMTQNTRRIKVTSAGFNTLDHHDKLEPVEGRDRRKTWTDCAGTTKVCRRMVSTMRNRIMSEWGDNDAEQYQYTLNFFQVGALNCAAINLPVKTWISWKKTWTRLIAARFIFSFLAVKEHCL